MSPPKKRRLSIEFLPEIDEQITALCQQKGMSRSKIVEVLVLLGLGSPGILPRTECRVRLAALGLLSKSNVFVSTFPSDSEAFRSPPVPSWCARLIRNQEVFDSVLTQAANQGVNSLFSDRSKN
jgi:hypothetical protein